MAFKEGRSNLRWNIFRNAKMEFQFTRTMASLSENGAEIGECLNVKQATKEGNIQSLSEAWTVTALFVEKEGKHELDVFVNSNLVQVIVRTPSGSLLS